jgi:hypothetical protein
LPERAGSDIGNRPHRSCDVGVSLKILIDHRGSPVIGERPKYRVSVYETTHRPSSNTFPFLPGDGTQAAYGRNQGAGR